MYQSHWGLSESPFRGCLDPEGFYRSPIHDEAMARLLFLVEQRRRLGILLGVAGSGKSLLLEVAAKQLRYQGLPVAKLSLAGVGPAEMLVMLAAGFQLNLDVSASLPRLWRKLGDRLAEYRYQQLGAVVLLDDADAATQPVLEQVTRLARHDPSPESRLTVVLAARADRISRLGERLLDLAELRIDVEPWQQTDTKEFLKTSLAQAGCQAPVFDDPAVARLHQLAQGIPRRVNQLADLALMAGAGTELKQINADVVESVYRELGLVEV